jgi:hypothetical protein
MFTKGGAEERWVWIRGQSAVNMRLREKIEADIKVKGAERALRRADIFA